MIIISEIIIRCPVPVFTDNTVRVRPVLAEWLETSSETLSNWQRLPAPKPVVQLYDFNVDSFTKMVYARVSDGNLWVPAVLHRDLAVVYRRGHLREFDVVHLIRSSGHNYFGDGYLTLVS